MIKSKGFFVLVTCVMLALGLCACASGGSGKSVENVKSTEQFDLHIAVNYESNVVFAVYDIDIVLDGAVVGNVSQGNQFDETVSVEKGSHVLAFKKTGQTETLAESSLSIEEESYFSCEVKAHTDSLDIKNQVIETAKERDDRLQEEQQAVKEKEEAEKKAAAEKEAAEKAEAEKKAAEEKAAAEKKESEAKAAAEKKAAEEEKDNENMQAKLEEVFPEEVALKAVTVALTNATASDVFGSDGNSHDVSKYHSYSDRSGDYLELVNNGKWTGKSEDTWHVEGLEYRNSMGTKMTASADVSFDGTNYNVSNLSGMLGEPGIGTSLDQFEKYYDDTWSYLTVTPDLLD